MIFINTVSHFQEIENHIVAVVTTIFHFVIVKLFSEGQKEANQHSMSDYILEVEVDGCIKYYFIFFGGGIHVDISFINYCKFV